MQYKWYVQVESRHVLLHSLMPQHKSEVHNHYNEVVEEYLDENSGLNKKRTVVTCLFCSKSFIFRDAQQLALYLPCPSEGIGKSSGCPTVKSIAPAVQVKYAAEVAAKEAETTKKKSTEKQRMAIEAAERDEERKKQKVSEGGSGTQRSISSSLASVPASSSFCFGTISSEAPTALRAPMHFS